MKAAFLSNHANLGQPGNVVGSPAFCRIVNTRFPAGESGSSRQEPINVLVITGMTAGIRPMMNSIGPCKTL